MKNISSASLDFLVSSLHKGSFIDTEKVLLWVKEENKRIQSSIEQIPLSKLTGWSFQNGILCHDSGKFFSIEGIRVSTNYGLIHQWDQPIINQPEIGFLGFIVKKINGVLHFLIQAKIEPGNINIVQLSPTLQATRSNYTRVHNGAAPLYLEYFNGEKDVKILVDQLQSEQGARFLQKRNRNIIVEIEEEAAIPIYENFTWVSLGQIKEFLKYPNLVNMDSRTVISCIHYGDYSEENINLFSAFKFIINKEVSIKESFLYSLLSNENCLNDISYIIKWITSLKFKYELNVKKITIPEINNWIYDGDTLHHEMNKYFSVIGVNIKIENREVVSWNQPMVKPAQEGIIGFLVKNINGIYHFLVQAKLEAGNFDIIELAPTVQCMTGNYRKGLNEYSIPYSDYFLEPKENNILYSTYQSEEGGRFYQEQNLNMIVEVGNEFPIEVEENYCWMTLNQMLSFVSYNNYLNIAARSLLAEIPFS